MARNQVAPSGACAGHCDGVRMQLRQCFTKALRLQQFQCECGGRAARAIECRYIAGGSFKVEREAISADTG